MYKEFLRENPDYHIITTTYGTENLELVEEKYLQENDIYYSMSNRKQVMEYPYLKMGEL